MMAVDTLNLGTSVHWEEKNELNRFVFSLKSDIALLLWKVVAILRIFLLLKNQLRIDQYDFGELTGRLEF